MKKIIISLIVMIFFLSLSVSSASAGSKQRHRWQGVAIGLGAAILGSALLNNACDSYPDRVVVVDRDTHRHRYSNCCRRGHWEITKTWVDPVCRNVWNPAHYNQYNQWVPGQYIMIEREPGYWAKQRVWVGCR